MKTYQANLLNGVVLILMPLWAYLTFEGTAEKPEQSVTAFIPLILGVILVLCNGGVKKGKQINCSYCSSCYVNRFVGTYYALKGSNSRWENCFCF